MHQSPPRLHRKRTQFHGLAPVSRGTDPARRRSMKWRPLGALLWTLLSGCDGVISLPDPLGAAPGKKPIVQEPVKAVVRKASACSAEVSPGPSPIRRMTRAEYDRTVRDLLGDDTHPAAAFSAEEEALGFTNNAMALTTTSDLVEKHMSAAEQISLRVTGRLATLPWYACNVGAAGEDVCAGRFIEAFGLRAFRRPLDDDTRSELVTAFQQGRSIGSVDAAGMVQPPFIAGLRLVIEAALQSPDFLYRVELSDSAAEDRRAPGPGLTRLNDYELASRLSYLLWGSMPDEALLEAAARGELQTPAQVSEQARRMLEVGNARSQVVEFHRQWLDFDRIHNVGKAASVFPTWTAAIPDLMQTESEQFVENVVFDGAGTWDALMSAPYSMMNPALAAFYKVPGLMAGSDFQKVALDPNQRAGLLTQGALMAVNAHTNQTSPVHRGKLVRETFLCEVLGAPPPEVMIVVPEPKPGSTARERFAQHSASNGCKGCHKLMDPLGFGFENLDGVGVYRTTESEKAIDDSGEIVGTDVPGPFNGVRGLANKLTASKQARRCYVKQWFRFAYGRGETAEDACSLERIDGAFERQRRDVKQLILALTQTDAFLYRRTGVTP